VTPSPLPSPNKTSLSLTDPVHLSKPTASLDTAVADSKGYFGRSVPYTDVHTAQMDTFYDLHISMKDSRLCVAAAVSRDTCFVACTQTFTHKHTTYLQALKPPHTRMRCAPIHNHTTHTLTSAQRTHSQRTRICGCATTHTFSPAEANNSRPHLFPLHHSPYILSSSRILVDLTRFPH